MPLHEENTVLAAEPASATFLLDEIMSQTRMAPGNDGYDIAKQGVAALLAVFWIPEPTKSRLTSC